MKESNSSFSLDDLQRWMQSCLVRPVDEKLREQHGSVKLEDIEKIIAPSKRMTARQRLAIYQRGYYARLLECMSKQFSVLQYALGEDLFRDFSYEYLQGYPSESYTLGDLGARFPDFLSATRPDKDAPPEERESWPDFMIELARLEWACFKLMECDGQSKGQAIAQDASGALAFHLPPGFHLFALQFPSYAYYKAVIDGQQIEYFPAPNPNYLLLANRKDRIGAFPLSVAAYAFWQQLAQGQDLAAILAQASVEVRAGWPEWRARWEEWGLLI